MEAQIQLLQEQQKLLKAENESKSEAKENKEAAVEEIETSFVDPSAEDIQELLEKPKDPEEKKTD